MDHCNQHLEYRDDCHWCHLRREAIARMTDRERKIWQSCLLSRKETEHANVPE